MYIDLQSVEPHIEWILSNPITFDKLLIVVQRLDAEADYYSFKSSEQYMQFIEALIGYVLSLVEEMYPLVYDQSFYDHTRQKLLAEFNK